MGGKRQILEADTRFGRLTVLSDDGHGFADCRCECGVVKRIKKPGLLRGQIVSCGCWSRERSTKHGMEGSPTYHVWASMLHRCRNRNNRWYHRYGGRGIQVCSRWLDFRNFYADMGEKPRGLSIERIDNDGDYEPGNCRWASHTEQMRNREVTLTIEYKGRVMPVVELAERFGVPRKLVQARLKRGVPIQDALSQVRLSRWGTPRRSSL